MHTSPWIQISVVAAILLLMLFLRNPPIKHIYREANSVTDWIAKKATNSCNDLAVFYQPPKRSSNETCCFEVI